MLKLKCATCPYNLGLIKTIVSPCPACITGKKSVSFKKICPRCGSTAVFGRCPRCKTRVTK